MWFWGLTSFPNGRPDPWPSQPSTGSNGDMGVFGSIFQAYDNIQLKQAALSGAVVAGIAYLIYKAV